MKKLIVEQRVWPLELRQDGEGDGYELHGYAAVFDTWSDIGGKFYERFMPGAFTKTINESDQVALWNHNDQYPLGRKSEGSLELSEDKHGLAFRVKLNPEIPSHKEVYLQTKNRLIKGASFRFSVVNNKEDWERDDEERLRRTIREVRLYEVSPVTFPAYEATELQARAAEYLKLAEVPLITKSVATVEPLAHSAAGDLEAWFERQYLFLNITEW